MGKKIASAKEQSEVMAMQPKHYFEDYLPPSAAYLRPIKPDEQVSYMPVSDGEAKFVLCTSTGLGLKAFATEKKAHVWVADTYYVIHQVH